MRLHRPIGIWLLLWPTLWAVWIAAAGRPDPKVFLIMVLGTIVARSAGCVINDFADRKIDPHVVRTADRPLAKAAMADIVPNPNPQTVVPGDFETSPSYRLVGRLIA